MSMNDEVRKLVFDAIGLVGAASNGALMKHSRTRELMKVIPPTPLRLEPEPDKRREPEAWVAWDEKRQRAQFSHYVKALHALGPHEIWDPRQPSGDLAKYRDHA